ncbi:hypothetical protein D3C76_1840010 [compost metagenome]
MNALGLREQTIQPFQHVIVPWRFINDEVCSAPFKESIVDLKSKTSARLFEDILGYHRIVELTNDGATTIST